MSKIYVPTEFLNKPCYTINNGYIRVYETINGNSNRIHDIYINQDYMIKEGTASYSTNTYCIDNNLITDQVYYRTDFDKILVMFVLLVIIFFSPGIKLFKRLFRRFR